LHGSLFLKNTLESRRDLREKKGRRRRKENAGPPKIGMTIR
jgi:hypothetical protein